MVLLWWRLLMVLLWWRLLLLLDVGRLLDGVHVVGARNAADKLRGRWRCGGDWRELRCGDIGAGTFRSTTHHKVTQSSHNVAKQQRGKTRLTSRRCKVSSTHTARARTLPSQTLENKCPHDFTKVNENFSRKASVLFTTGSHRLFARSKLGIFPTNIDFPWYPL